MRHIISAVLYAEISQSGEIEWAQLVQVVALLVQSSSYVS